MKKFLNYLKQIGKYKQAEVVEQKLKKAYPGLIELL